MISDYIANCTYDICVSSFIYGDLYTMMYWETHAGAQVVYIRSEYCKSFSQFFHEIATALRFPNYFGMNFNAFDDCITDLEWLKFNSIFIVLDDFSKMFNGNSSDQDAVCYHLRLAMEYWKSQGVPFKVLLNN